MTNLKEKILKQIEDVMMADDLNKNQSIKFLYDYYSSNEATAFNIDYILMILKELRENKIY
jgi:hypothetical protein